MRNDKNKAIDLRKQGKSYNQIAIELGIPKSTLSTWLKYLKISAIAQEKINKRASKISVNALVKRNKEQTAIAQKKHEFLISNASLEVKKRIKDELFLTGIMLYWGEGYKKGAYGSKWKCIDFTNSDPAMIRLMIKFFKKVCKIKDENFKIQISGYSKMDKAKAISYWKSITGLSDKNFTKIFLDRRNKKNENQSLPYGTAHIRISNVEQFFRIIGWIEGIKKYFKIAV